MMGGKTGPAPDRRVAAVLEAAAHLQHIMTFSGCGGHCPICSIKIDAVLDQLNDTLSSLEFEDASIMEDGVFVHGARERQFRSDWPDGMFMHDMFEDGPFGSDFDHDIILAMMRASAGFAADADPGPQPDRVMPNPDDLRAVMKDDVYVVILTG